MPVTADFETIGTYIKLKDRTAVVGVLPNRLNEDPYHFGLLEEKNRMDLKKGCQGFRDEGYGDLFYSFFDYIKKTSKQGIPLKDVICSDFISTRRNLISFAASLYSRQSFVIRALRKNGVIFLCDKRSENQTSDGDDPGYGKKFEQYMTLKDNGEPYDEEEEVSNAECVKAVLRTSFKKGDEEIKVLYAAEIDALDSDGSVVEIKTARFDQETWVKRRSHYHYLQSFLGNAPLIIRGQVTDDQVVFKVEKVETDDILHMNVDWKADESMEQLFRVLHEIKLRLKNDDEAIVIRIGGRHVYYEVENAMKCSFVDANFLRYFE
ncbi:hypothetical protein GCK72_018711 [Caenorhabditis remanei]|uniref:Decapping nuclease n=1 Tax=Caenorhabditis remanei TaxID=31234 RepID=A0A6A5GAH8_CAERE|nr:hypothetical protein GCK72_018711 [Caenorhabditis remanei]KAF1752157.1 hypothetical protein GCK72_018711 [Caenorhabditis remanei]